MPEFRGKLYFILHIDNLTKVVGAGILSHNGVSDLQISHKRIDNQALRPMLWV